VRINDGGDEVRMMRPNSAPKEIGSEASEITYEQLYEVGRMKTLNKKSVQNVSKRRKTTPSNSTIN
jgi:hypothetical protein